MARIRTIKPEFWQDEALSALPEAAHILAAVLLNYADDEGYFNANPRLIKAGTTPLREDSVSTTDSLHYLSKSGFIRFGNTPDGKRYGHVVNFLKHQRINKPTPSKISNLDIIWESYHTPTTPLREDSPTEMEQGTGNGREKEMDSLPPLSLAKVGRDMNQKFALGTILHFAKFRAVYPKQGDWLKAETEWRQKNCDAIAELILADIPKRKAEHANWQEIKFILNPENYLKREEWKNEIIRKQTELDADRFVQATPGCLPKLREERRRREELAREQNTAAVQRGVD